ncbi:MAG TPA: DNA repair protein RadA [Bacteroidales bacterium]|nr:DNA repair protein RadA [Bacteroidales bacterium]
MAKARKAYVCSECGYESAKWIGQCPACHSWNSFKEITVQKSSSKHSSRDDDSRVSKVHSLRDINAATANRYSFPFDEFNRVLGGGLVPGTVALMAGEPGVGKSTLLLQLLLKTSGQKSLYCAGEESLQQVKLRAERTGNDNSGSLFTDETNVDKFLDLVRETEAKLVVVDSIQTSFCEDVDSVAGSITQIRESAARIIRFAKQHHVSFVLVGHITKSGNIAGPMVLEHMVDLVMQFEGDQNNLYRILRARKNRFGSTQEIGVFEMKRDGLHEVSNPSEMFVSARSDHLSGVAYAATIEGMRPMLIELQALVSSAVYGNPQRTSTGFDIRRLNMLLAVLEKRAGFRLNQKDVFVNIVGGLRLIDPGMDLPLLASILSSDQDVSVPEGTVLCGEVGLSGEVRSASRVSRRISEADRLGFKRIITPPVASGDLPKVRQIQIVQVDSVSKMMKALFR